MAGTILTGLDVLGKELSLGDDILFTRYGNEFMYTGKISRVTEKIVYCTGAFSEARITKWKGKTNRIVKI